MKYTLQLKQGNFLARQLKKAYNKLIDRAIPTRQGRQSADSTKTTERRTMRKRKYKLWDLFRHPY